MVLAPIVALGVALWMSRWPRFALGMGTVAFFVVLTAPNPSTTDGLTLQALTRSGRPGRGSSSSAGWRQEWRQTDLGSPALARNPS